jgi:hypothetical protein
VAVATPSEPAATERPPALTRAGPPVPLPAADGAPQRQRGERRNRGEGGRPPPGPEAAAPAATPAPPPPSQ